MMGVGRRVSSAAVSTALSLVVLLLGAVLAGAAPVPTTTCQVFPADNIWNTDISALPVHARSAQWLASMSAATTNLHPDFGGPPYGFPFNVVNNTHPTVSVSFQYASESDPGPYPVGADTSIENGSDRHALIVNRDTCTLYELYALAGSGSTWTAGSGAIFPLGSDALRPLTWTSADAAGLPIFPGLVRWDEVQAGAINHAIRFTAVRTDRSFVWPARHQAGAAADPTLPPMGARFRLKAGFDISRFSAQAQVILRALQHYGLILADNGSNWFFSGTLDANWQDSLLSELKTVPAAQFEAIDESSLMVDPNSAATTPTAPPAAPGAPVAIAGEASATVSWSAPSGVVSSYTVLASPGGATATVPGGTLSATVAGLTDGTAYTFTVTASNSVGTGPASGPSNAVVPGRGQFVALPPKRILDTRSGSGPVGPAGTLNVPIAGQAGVPATGVSAVVMNVTVTNTTASSYLTVWPTGFRRPVASNLNWSAGTTVPNLVEVALGTGGSVSVYNAFGSTDVVFDVAGYVASPTATPVSAGRYNPIVPNRVLDTRIGLGAAAQQLCAYQSISVKIAGTPNVPSTGVAAVVLNVTATNTVVAPSYVTVYPTGDTRPVASNLNFQPGQTVANRVVVKLGTGGSVDFFDYAGHTDVVADVAGWFTDGTTSSAGSLFVGVPPTRILDTRTTSSPVGPNASIVLPVAGQGGVPAMNATVPPTAVVLNVTVTNPTASSYLTAWPDGASRPVASDLNYVPGLTVPNLVVVKLGANGAIDLYNAFGLVDVVVDVVGWDG